MKTKGTDTWKMRKRPQPKYHHEDEVGIYALAAAIVKQAVDDYREAEKLEQGVVRCNSTSLPCPKAVKGEVVKFFYSSWYGTLCDIDPERILKKLGVM